MILNIGRGHNLSQPQRKTTVTNAYCAPEQSTAPTRIEGWETLLSDTIIRAQSRPFAWGSHDCAIWAFDTRRLLTSGPDHASLWRGRYRTALGATRVMRKLGWRSLEEGGRVLLGPPLKARLLAQRGDLVLGGSPEAFGVCLGAQAAFVGADGIMLLPLPDCRLAWRT